MPATEQTGDLGAQVEPASRPRAGKVDLGEWTVVELVGWMIGIAILGFLVWVAYVVIALGAPACPRRDFLGLDFHQGGSASGGSLVAAAALAGCLWLAAGVAAWRLRRRLARLFAGFVGFYVVALVALWEISPLLWGQRHC